MNGMPDAEAVDQPCGMPDEDDLRAGLELLRAEEGGGGAWRPVLGTEDGDVFREVQHGWNPGRVFGLAEGDPGDLPVDAVGRGDEGRVAGGVGADEDRGADDAPALAGTQGRDGAEVGKLELRVDGRRQRRASGEEDEEQTDHGRLSTAARALR